MAGKAETLTALGDLAKQLEAAGEDAEKSVAIAKQIDAALGTLSKDQMKELLGMPAVARLFEIAGEKQAEGKHDDEAPPGTYNYRNIGGNMVPVSKKPWDWRWLNTRYPMKLIMNDERKRTICFQGLCVTLLPRERKILPEPFYGVWERKIIDEGLAEQHAEYLFKRRAQPPDDPSILTPASFTSRETANHDGSGNLYNPGGGIPPMADPVAAVSASDR